ncbi:MAG: N-acylglucosamine 2-epimerase [Betaproteobacteria bacterium]|nr:N-acylglucosamine 2-epimerase [Betaproteobacteria bacterium]
MNPTQHTITALRHEFETELFERVIPFWEKHSWDKKNGGFWNCLDRTGQVFDNTKYGWLQGRETWLFSKLYRTVERKPLWLEMARSGAEFLKNTALTKEDRLPFRMTADGKPIYIQRKIFSECFYIMAMAEYSRASGDESYAREAQRMFEKVWAWAFDWSKVGRPSYEGETPLQSLAVPMILMNLIEELTDGHAEPFGRELADCQKAFLKHVKVAEKRVYEFVRPDGSLCTELPEGRQLNPGHAIEAGWFLQHWAQRQNNPELSLLAQDVVRWSHAEGWDKEKGGLFYFLDAQGHSPTQLEWNMKLWWPHCEALYAHLLNFSLTRSAQDWDLFTQTKEYTFKHFPDRTHGEWYGYLDRDGRVSQTFKGGPYKCAFHVPRALLLCWNTLKKLESEK